MNVYGYICQVGFTVLTFAQLFKTVISENQSGLRKGYSTLDSIFNFHALVELYFLFGMKLYCTSVDFRKLLIQFPDLCGKIIYE